MLAFVYGIFYPKLLLRTAKAFITDMSIHLSAAELKLKPWDRRYFPCTTLRGPFRKIVLA